MPKMAILPLAGIFPPFCVVTPLWNVTSTAPTLSLNEAGYVLGKSNAAVKQLQVQALQAIHTLFR